MGKIVTLDRHMINMIAAGEVIERPESVLKELIENSIDSGAGRLVVTIADGGRKLISVSDDGCGIEADDLEAAFEPHATSKIKTSVDLGKISTLGFRGEALASIGSVAKVKATSRTSDCNAGCCIEIDCGDKSEVMPASCDYGTTIEVRDLFYKLPARRKFLKTANTEMSHISETFKKLALANCDLEFVLIHNNKKVYQLPGNQGIKNRIGQLFSKSISDNLVETVLDEKGICIRALIGNSEISKTTNKFQYAFLNGRFIRDKFISHAIKEAYRGHLDVNRFGVVFLFIEMPADSFDVNVHPQKIEVRFYNSNLVHSQILGCIREKILATDFDAKADLTLQSERKTEINDAMADFFRKYHTGESQRNLDFRKSFNRQKTGSSHDSIGKHLNPETVSYHSSVSVSGLIGPRTNAIQIQDSFIVTETEEGFVIIDQHALHERIMYESLKKKIAGDALESQKLLIPECFDCSDSQIDLIESESEIFKKLGIELECFGPKTMAIQAFPILLEKADPVEFVCDLLDILEDKSHQIDAKAMIDDILKMASCKAAIKAGQRLTAEEIEHLLAEKAVTECSSRCPHGRPTTLKFSTEELFKQFKRT